MSVSLRRGSPFARPLRVLLLHGLGSSSQVWDGFVARAVGGLELWAAELPWGADGDPRWAEDPDATQWVTRALDLPRSVGRYSGGSTGHCRRTHGQSPRVLKPAPQAAPRGGADLVVAHSFAANVLLAAFDRTDPRDPFRWNRLRAAVLVSPFYRPSADRFDWATIDYYLNDFDRILEEGVRVRSNGRLEPDVQHEMALHVRERVGAYGWVRFFDTYLRTPMLSTERLDLPCLVIAGERDSAASPSDGAALAAALPDCELHVLPGCGHFPMVERPDAFAALVNAFVDQAVGLVHPAREPIT